MGLFLVVVSCENKPESGEKPSIRLLRGCCTISTDTAISPGETMAFAIEAKAGDFPVTQLSVRVISESMQTYFDTGMFVNDIIWDGEFVKSFNDNETWEFVIRDRYSQESSVSIEIANDTISGLGQIITLENIVLGAQNNETGGFYSLDSNAVYPASEAQLHQEIIDKVYYYYGEDENVIASPGANIESDVFSADIHPANWDIRNTTRYIPLDYSIQDFDVIQNDSTLIASYLEGEGKRKAKNLIPGNVFSFKTHELKFGMMKINEVNGAENGTISIDVKIQQ